MKNIKNIIPFIASLALANLAGGAEKLTIEPAHALPDYDKLNLATGTSERWLVHTVASGDFNEDARMDVVVMTHDIANNGVSVFLQESNGTFVNKIEYLLPFEGPTWDFIVADFNEDGHLDVVNDDLGNDLLILAGKGDGTFEQARYLGLSAPGFPVAADLNGDHHLDLVAGTLDGTVGVFIGAGNATFSLKRTLDTQIVAYHPRKGQIMVGDLNRDGKPDVAVAAGNDAGVGNLDVFLGNGDGTFQEAIRTPNVATWKGALGDFNGDGILDFVGDRYSPKQLEIWLGQGDGHFIKGKVYSLSVYTDTPDAVKVGDLNNDGVLDVVVSGEANGAIAAPLSIFLGRGDGTFAARQSFTQIDNWLIYNSGPQLVDFNGDGLLDIINVSAFPPSGQPPAFTVALNKGVKLDPNLGFLLKVQNSTPNTTGPVVLEASTNLVDWIPLATNSPAATWPMVDTRAGLQQRYYRTRRP